MTEDMKMMLELLKWNKFSDKMPHDTAVIEVRELVPRDEELELNYENAFYIYYHICIYFKENKGGMLGLNPTQYTMKYRKELDELEGFISGMPILVDFRDGNIEKLNNFQWRYIIEENGEITIHCCAI